MKDIEDLYLIIRRGMTNEYLGSDSQWGPLETAGQYTTSLGLYDAKQSGGQLYLVFPSGREVRVEAADFE